MHVYLNLERDEFHLHWANFILNNFVIKIFIHKFALYSFPPGSVQVIFLQK